MEILPKELIVLGSLLLLALAAEAVGRHTRIPRISLLVILGFVLGPAAFEIIDPRENPSFEFVAILALSMVGFLVGGKLNASVLRRSGSLIMHISVSQALFTFALVTTGLLLLGLSAQIALLLGAIATATDPAATMDAVRQSRSRGRFAEVLTGVVAVDDAWGLILFALAVAAAQFVNGTGVEGGAISHASTTLANSLFLGVGLGLPMASLSGRIRRGEPTLLEATGIVMLCAGLAKWLGVSPLLSCVVLGVTVTNFAKHHKRPFHALEEIEWPFLAIFFLFSGAYLNPASLAATGSLLLAYLVLRVLGRVGAGLIFSRRRSPDSYVTRGMGFALLPQAGVALAMTFEACNRYPELQDTLLPTVIAATIIFEISGPIMARKTLEFARSKEDD